MRPPDLERKAASAEAAALKAARRAELDAKVRRYLGDGMTATEVATRLGISRQGVASVAKRLGIEAKAKGQGATAWGSM